MNTKSAVILAAAAATVSAVSADQKKQLDIILQDVGANINEYINLVSDPSSGITFDNLPAGLIDIGEEVAVNPSDTSYTSEYDNVDIAGVSLFVTRLSWYSDRLAPKLDAAGVPIAAEAKKTSAVETTKAAETTAAAETTTATPATSAAAETTKAAETSAAPATSAKAEETSAAPTTSAAAKTSAKTSKAAEQTTKATSTVAQAISQIGDGQIQATASVHQQTENAAAKAVAGLGAGAMAAVALLL